MKLIIPVFLLFIGAASCANRPKVSMAEIGQAPTFRATVEGVQRHAVQNHLALTIRLRKGDGSTLTVYEPEATLIEAAFAEFLQPGHTYMWPGVFVEFEQRLHKPMNKGMQIPFR